MLLVGRVINGEQTSCDLRTVCVSTRTQLAIVLLQSWIKARASDPENLLDMMHEPRLVVMY